MNKAIIDEIFDKTVKKHKIQDAVLFIENFEGDFSLACTHGNAHLHSPLLMASVTKLFTTASIIILSEQGKLSLDDLLIKYLDKQLLKNLHVFKTVDYTEEITISDLLFQTSGLADWYEAGKTKNKVIKQDFSYSFQEMLEKTKAMNARFAPNSGNKANYSDSNFDLLSEIIEKVTEKPLACVFDELIFQPLGLKNTYLASKDTDFVPDVYHKQTKIHRPHFIISNRGSGGAVTTAQELMIFIKAFFTGALFSSQSLTKLSNYRKLMFPMLGIQYGGGFMRFPLDGTNTLFRGKGELLGHSGSTSSFAFYYPQKNLFLVGNFSQMNAMLPFRLLSKLAVKL